MFHNNSFTAVLVFLCTVLSAGVSPMVNATGVDVARDSNVGAQQSGPVLPLAAPQITQAIDPAQLSPMQMNVRPEVADIDGKTIIDNGPVDDGLVLNHLLLFLHRPDAQEQALDQFMDEQVTYGSPNYHNWLTVEEIAQYGPAQSDIDKLTAWLQTQGFTLNQVSGDHLSIDFSGTAGLARQAFHTEIHSLSVNGQLHFANMTVPEIPSALAPAVTGIESLNDFRPHAHRKPAAPDYTTGGSYLVVPADLATIYHLNPLFSGSPKINGAGQKIVLLEQEDPYLVSDITTFRSTFGLPAFGSSGGPTFTQVHPSCTDPGDSNDGTDGEVELDIEWAGAAAPGASLVMASCAEGLLVAMQHLNSANDTARLWSVSYGACEAQAPGDSFSSTYQTASARGVSVFVSSGDQGAASCDGDTTSAVMGISVSGLASTAYNVAVGGTDFGDSYAGTNGSYWSSANSPTYGSALSYINEIPWNDSCAGALLAAYAGARGDGNGLPYGTAGFCNNSIGENYLTNAAGSGGPSNCYTGTPASGSGNGGSCRGNAKPSWQSGVVGIPADGVRDLPDVSLFAANGVWGHSYVYCYSNPGANLGGAPCTGAPSGWSRAGGTSFASPIMAGIQALVNQNSGSSQGNPNPTYYSLAAAEYGASGSSTCNSSKGNAVGTGCIFYDVTEGDMDVNCTGTDNCYRPSGTNGVLSTSNSAYQPAYGTHTGWDFATGIGTVNAANLVNNWPGVAPTKLVFSLEPNGTYASGASITVHVSVENASGSVITTDTSAVTLALSGGTAGATLSGSKTVNAVAGVATFTGLSVDKVGAGYQLVATDGTLTSATSTAFTITAGVAKTVGFTTQPAANSNIVAGATIPIVAHVVDAAGNGVSGQNVSLAIANNPGGSTLIGGGSVNTDSSGNATFTNVALNKIGIGYTLTGMDNSTPAATPATSNAFNIIAGAPVAISFTQQPTTTSVNTSIAPPLVVHAQDSSGNAVSGDNVALTIGTNPGGAGLAGGNATATDASGNATFSSVMLDKVGTGYTLMATDASAVPLKATSNTFNIGSGVPALAFTTQPANVAAGNVLATIAVTEEDGSGQPVTGDNTSVVDFTVAACSGTVDLGSAQMVAGVGTLTTSERFYTVTAAPGLQISAASASLSGTSQYFVVTANPDLVFSDSFDGCRL